MRGVALDTVEHFGEQRRLAQMSACFANHQRHMAFAHFGADDVVRVRDQADCADCGVGKIAVPSVSLYSDTLPDTIGMSSALTACADPFDRADELAHDFRLFGVAEVHVVGRGQRPRANSAQVAIGFGHRLFAALNGLALT